MSTKTKTIALAKPPLLEAVFEMRWELAPVPNSQIRRDVSYPLLYGRIYDRFKGEYGIVEDLPSVQAHPDASPYVVRHRMRKEADRWPLVQVGPGIITVNEGKGTYSWERFRDEIVRVFEAFVDFYPASSFPLNILKTELRFINGVEMDGKDSLGFLENNLHTKVVLDPELMKQSVEGATLNVGFKLEKPVGNALLSVGSGAIDEKPAMIQQMLFQSVAENAPQDFGSLDPWLDEMHRLSKSWFEALFRGELMKQFV